MPFYAVVRGRQPGVYESWPDTKAQVDGFKGSMQKKFPTKGDAQAFMDKHSPGWRASGAGRAAPGSDGGPVAGGSSKAGGTPPATTTNALNANDELVLISREELRRLQEKSALAERVASSAAPSSSSSSPALVSSARAKRSRSSTSPHLDPLDNVDRGRTQSHAGVLNKRRRSTSPFRADSPAAQILGGVDVATNDSKEWMPLPDACEDVEEDFDGGLLDDDQLMSVTASSSASTSDQFKFYVVVAGRIPGIYNTFNEAKAQVPSQYTIQPKGFATRAEAEAYLATYAARNASLASDPDPRDPATLVAFTDGSALNNGMQGCRAGWAVVFPHNESWNWAEKMMTGRLTNNAAEYLAAHAAIKRANEEDPTGTKPLYIFSDSMLLINTMKLWVDAWEKNNWKKRDGQPVINATLLQNILAAQGSRRILWRHVKAHSGRKDWHSVWNDKADGMAKGAAMGLPGPAGPPPQKMHKRIAGSASRRPAGRGHARGSGSRLSRGARRK
ncbi:RNA-DNA hybrid ribonuclease [Geranomyces michiganensis]|nr:RNA-DNA hybrid ribonuclease [Geranomyces michiganensis]